MFARLKNLFGGAPAEKSPVNNAAVPSEWSSMSLDPEMTPLGAARQDASASATTASLGTHVVAPGLVSHQSEPVESLMSFELLAEDDSGESRVVERVQAKVLTEALAVEAPSEAPPQERAIDAPVIQTQEVACVAAAEALPTTIPSPDKAASSETSPKATKTKARTKPAAKAASKKVSKKTAPAARTPDKAGISSFNKGPWRLPGVDGWSGAPLNDNVEFVGLDNIVTASA